MQTDRYTFWSLLTAADELGKPLVRHLQVPIIQRDYAQGRPDVQATAVRTGLLAALRDALRDERPLTLDFVYGELDPARRFVPLDGQQRLTTLFLLHWYLALQAGRLHDSDVQAVLGKFSYETRSSARDFCRRLVSKPLTAWQAYPSLSQALCDQAWYQPAWAHDPTVAAMLVVLDALNDKAFGAEASWFARLTDPVHPLVGFYWLEMQRVGLSDDLYLKMNARGKPLTPFENWKAQFDLLLQAQGRAGEFGQKADNEWTDFFWRHRRFGVAVVDECFSRYLHYFTRMLAYQRPDLRTDAQLKELTAPGPLPFTWFERVYAQPESVALLFDSLDFLASVQKTHPQGLPGLLNELFTKKAEPERVRLFGNSQVDLFGQLLRDPHNTPDPASLLQEQVLLFGFLTYGATVAQDAFALPDARNLLRVLRNLLERTRQQEDTALKSDLRARDLPAFADACAALATAAGGRSPNVYERLATASLPSLRERGVAHERQKAALLRQAPEWAAAVHELENQDVLRGDLHNLQPEVNAAYLPDFAAAVREIWGSPLPQSLIIRAWLTVGDYRRTQGRETGGGRKCYFGNNGDWYLILATDLEANQPNILPEFLQAYTLVTGSTPSAKLSRLIADWLREQQQRDTWRYYFVKYAEMTAESQGSFTWISDFRMQLLSKFSIKAYHISPFVRTLVLRGQVAGAVTASENFHWEYGDYRTPLWLHGLNGVRKQKQTPMLTCQDDGWVLSLPANYAPPAGIQAAFRLRPTTESTWLLPASASHDRIQRAEKFMQALHEQGVEYLRPTP